MTMIHTMIRAPRRAGLLFAALLLPLFAGAAEDGYYIETINRGSAVMSEGPQESLSKTYIGHGKMKVVNSGENADSMILDPESGVMTFLNDSLQQYFTINVADVAKAMADPSMAQMRAMISETKVSVEDTGETRQIGDWECRKYAVTKQGMMQVEQEVWATEEIDLDVRPYTRMMRMSGASDIPGGAEQMAELDKIKGFPILTVSTMNMMGTEVRTETEVTEVRRQAIPADTFTVPEGYQLKEIGMGMAPPAEQPQAQ
ncbi:DUF4412 domain-containing protein [Marichromatium bheemlicum]|uniref:DUF4412 domain-containing protein n=1 Tax=Marichromatium bheemlicum TaxID=365339 RepID=A0ABX1I5U8_9GAMM|nr:DUF4412 domain-containing protein [Marichromatium bheemlicum]NKN32429.1 DUF4412 domain-containing protein [Marichromatium bheemlicum]